MTLSIALTDDLATCHALRRIVFTDEQGVSVTDDVDGKDDAARHLLALSDGRPVGTARLLTSGTTGKIGRVCVLADARGQGLCRPQLPSSAPIPALPVPSLVRRPAPSDSTNASASARPARFTWMQAFRTGT
jgi:hypothetical protein